MWAYAFKVFHEQLESSADWNEIVTNGIVSKVNVDELGMSQNHPKNDLVRFPIL